MFCAGRVVDEDLKRTLKACGGAILTTVADLNETTLGTCDLFEEKQVGGDRYNLLTGCPNAKTATIVLRGGSQQFMDETERSLHDAIMIVRRAMKNDAIVAGRQGFKLSLHTRARAYCSFANCSELKIVIIL
jgi:T-complex protein 1 subunit eta